MVLGLDHEDLKRALLHLVQKSGLERSLLILVELGENFHLADIVECLLPLALVQVPSSKYDEVSAVSWHELDSFHVVLLDKFSEITIDNFLANSCLVLGEVWNFKEHRCGHVNTVKHLQVAMEVRWNVSLLLLNLLLEGLFLLPSKAA